MKHVALFCIMITILFTSCQSYTAKQALPSIAEVSTINAKPEVVTKYSAIQAEKQSALDKQDKERQEKEAMAEEEQRQQAMQLTLSELEALKQEKETLLQQVQTLEKNLGNAQDKLTALDGLQQEREDLLAKIQDLGKQLESSRKGLEQTQQKASEFQQNLSASQNLLTSKATNLEEAEAQINALSAQIQALSTELGEEKQYALVLQDNLEIQNKEFGRIQNQYQLSSLANKDELEKTQKALSEAQAQYLQGSDRIGELETQLAEQKYLSSQFLAEIEQQKAQSQAKQEEMISQHAVEIESLENNLQDMQRENELLKTQLGEKTATLEEKTKLEQERLAQIQRQEEARIQEKAAYDAEQQRLAEIEMAKKQAQQELWKQIPPVDQLSFPRIYSTEKDSTLLQENEQLPVMMLPLDDKAWDDPAMVKEVHRSIADLAYPVIFVTGNWENIIALVREMNSDAVLVQGGAIITSLPIVKTTNYGVTVQFSEKKTLRLAIANLPEYKVLNAFTAKQDWQAVQKQVSTERKAELKRIVEDGLLNEATIIGASLYEPSHLDWSKFSPISYRQVDYLWPMSAFLEESGFYDIYRATHFSSATDSGNTLVSKNWKERVDFLFSRKALPLSSSMLTIGGESVPDGQGISRFALVSSVLVP